jgi:flagellar M-ring protein FliF
MVVLMALLFIVRPMALRLALAGEARGGPDQLLLTGPDVSGMPGAGLIQPAGAAALLADESMIEMANIEGQLRASNIRKLAEMVEKHPDESLSIMRGWMSQERA